MRLKMRTILIFFFFLSSYAFSEDTINWKYLGVPSSSRYTDNRLEINLIYYFAPTKWDLSGIITKEGVEKSITNTMLAENQDHNDYQFDVGHAFSLTELKKIIFYDVSDPIYFGTRNTFAYNDSLKKYFYLEKRKVEDINELLSTEDIHLSSDTEILRYCQFITILLNPDLNVHFIADIKEILLEAVTTKLSYYNLDRLKQFESIKAGMPIILRNGSEIEAIYFAAIHESIYKIDVIIQDQQIKCYDKQKVGEVPYWRGYFSHYRR